MEDAFLAHRDAAIALLDRLIGRGREIADRLDTTPEGAVDIRAWQQDCAVAVNELSGGSKAHWLSRAFSTAYLVPPSAGGVVVEAGVVEIVGRLNDVLARAKASLAAVDGSDVPGGALSAPEPRRFDFVHDAQLRPVLELAYQEARSAFDEGDFHRATLTASGLLEAIVTDALAHAGVEASTWTFGERIRAAEQRGLVRSGFARLPDLARRYREAGPDASAS